MTFIAEQAWRQHWNCHRADEPQRVTGGPSPSAAFVRCCEVHGVDPGEFVAAEKTESRVVFRRRGPCPECGGSGKYVGLYVVEPCRTCNGAGRA